jgi:hypothetical protein
VNARLLLLALSLVATGAAAQLQVKLDGQQQQQVNAWDALETGLSRSVRAVGCTEGACSVDALVLDNQAAGDCLDDMLVVGGYEVEGRSVTGTEIAVKIDAETMAATRYYRAFVKVVQPGPQRLCVRRSMQVGGMRYSMTLDRPETAEQLAQAAGVQTRNNRSASELRLAPFVNSRGTQVQPDGWERKLAGLILYSDRRTPIGLSIRVPGSRLPIGHGDRIIGYTDKMVFAPANLLRDLYVKKGEEKLAIGNCAKTVEGIALVVTC